MRILARPTLSAVVCLLLWLALALNEGGWIGCPFTRSRSWDFFGPLLFILLLIAWIILVIYNLWAWRQRPRRAQINANILCLGLTALLVFEIPPKATTMFYLWHNDFQNIAQKAQQLDPNQYIFHDHWKYGTVYTSLAPDDVITVHFDYGIDVAGLLYNPHDKPVQDEWSGLCDPNHRSGGFINHLEPKWFLCEKRY